MTDDPRLERLILKATTAQWSADSIDFTVEPVLPERLPRAIYIDMVSQLYHGELAALAMLDRLVRELPEDQARRFLATQIADEHRHAAVYRGYLERLGDIAPIDPGLAAIFKTAQETQLPAFAGVVALNIVMEHEALAQQHKRIDTLPCPLFGAINRAIIADESRHAGFGVVYLARALPAAKHTDRLAVTTWVRELWGLWCAANSGRYAAAGAEVLRLEQIHLAERWTILSDRLARLGLATSDELAEAA